MKKNLFLNGIMLICLSILSTALISCTDSNQTNNENSNTAKEGNQQLSSVIQGYMDIKDALVNDNAQEAQSEAQELANNEDLGSLSEIKSSVTAIAQTTNITEQRNHFAELSQNLYQQVKNEANVDQTLYWNHCPMAMNNNGANWLSKSENIQNPYMGQKMPKCGSVKETINQ